MSPLRVSRSCLITEFSVYIIYKTTDISNNVLGMLAAESNLHYFVKMQVPRYNDWMFPIFVNIEVDKEAKILMPHK